ncbi:MAG: hypothetical protein LBM61_04465 [Prevotellaceae bacterium]|jgi:hypothetical protein|nr:hypothetical protein [Prevotellaceae bacterium]
MKLKEIENKLVKVVVETNQEFISAVSDSIIRCSRVITLFPDDELSARVDCVNRDCTANGFNLTNEVWRAIQSVDKETTGRMRCAGKEDEKYRSKGKMHRRGCACDTTLYYRITVTNA